jgi:hypothetical protein
MVFAKGCRCCCLRSEDSWFSWVLGIIGESASPKMMGRYVTALIVLLGFLFGPIILLFRRPSRDKGRQVGKTHKNTEPASADRPRE